MIELNKDNYDDYMYELRQINILLGRPCNEDEMQDLARALHENMVVKDLVLTPYVLLNHIDGMCVFVKKKDMTEHDWDELFMELDTYCLVER